MAQTLIIISYIEIQSPHYVGTWTLLVEVYRFGRKAAPHDVNSAAIVPLSETWLPACVPEGPDT